MFVTGLNFKGKGHCSNQRNDSLNPQEMSGECKVGIEYAVTQRTLIDYISAFSGSKVKGHMLVKGFFLHQ